MAREPILKTWKLFIGGAFPRTESGRTMILWGGDDRVVAHCCQGSRKDLRNTVEVARQALPGWWARDAYNRSQILYRIASTSSAVRPSVISAIR